VEARPKIEAAAGKAFFDGATFLLPLCAGAFVSACWADAKTPSDGLRPGAAVSLRWIAAPLAESEFCDQSSQPKISNPTTQMSKKKTRRDIQQQVGQIRGGRFTKNRREVF
jgi:hypothetical protein